MELTIYSKGVTVQNMKLPNWLQLKPEKEVWQEEYPRTSEDDFIIGEITPCHHQWQERTQSYAPPRQDVSTNYSDPDLLSTLLLGVTTIIDECLLCHELRKTSMLGSPNPQLDQILDNILKYGPQYIQKDGHTFAFQEYIPPRQQLQQQITGGVPIR